MIKREREREIQDKKKKHEMKVIGGMLLVQ